VTWFEDLSAYTYSPEGPALNVGWLDRDEAFETGDIGTSLRQELFLERILHAARFPAGPAFMGLHQCNLCDSLPGPRGTGEIRLTGPNGTVFASPTLLPHYVSAHRYRPPATFVDAVFTGRFQLPEPWQAGEEAGEYAPNELLDEEHQLLASEAVAYLAGISASKVMKRMSFLVAHRLVWDRESRWDLQPLPKLQLGYRLEGARFEVFSSAGPYWDGTKDAIPALVGAMLSDHSLERLRAPDLA
jgi:hypothetical protein